MHLHRHSIDDLLQPSNRSLAVVFKLSQHPNYSPPLPLTPHSPSHRHRRHRTRRYRHAHRHSHHHPPHLLFSPPPINHTIKRHRPNLLITKRRRLTINALSFLSLWFPSFFFFFPTLKTASSTTLLPIRDTPAAQLEFYRTIFRWISRPWSPEKCCWWPAR